MISGGDEGPECQGDELSDSIWTSEEEEFIKLVSICQRVWWATKS